MFFADKKTVTIGGTIPTEVTAIKYTYDTAEAWTFVSMEAMSNFINNFQTLSHPFNYYEHICFSGMPHGPSPKMYKAHQRKTRKGQTC